VARVFGEYDGYVPAAGIVLDPCAAGRVVSPTQLEDAAACPFRYFLKRGLGIDAIETGERDRDVWLDPLIRGSLLHDLYAAFSRRCRADQRRAAAADGDWLQVRGRETLAELKLAMPPPSRDVEDRETRDFLADLALFAAAECETDEARTPLGFEVAFGRGSMDREGEDDDEPLGQTEPVTVDLGDGLSVRIAGRIDRIDRIERTEGRKREVTFEIVDYKTGGYWENDWKGTFAGGRRLQHALYGLAATELLRRRHATAVVAGADYYFSSAKGRQERKSIPAPAPAITAKVLTDLREVIASGLFVHTADGDDCKWCDFGHACGKRAHEHGSAKLPHDSLLPFRRLRTYD
jgi:ATP-dependent helicase/nuclease subunit B